MVNSIRVPESAQHWVQAHSRASVVYEQGFDLNLDWWSKRLGDLPGTPVTADDGRSSGRGHISRAGLFALAERAIEDESGEGALRLLWATLLWGTGDSNRNNRQRIEAVARDPKGASAALRSAALLSREDPVEAFLVLRPGRNRISFLGPAFFTKFLYFAGGGSFHHSSLIVDHRVLRTLWCETGAVYEALQPRHNYGSATYAAALEILHDWAQQLSTESRSVAADEIERWAFHQGR